METRKILKKFHERIITAFLQKNSRDMKKSLVITAFIDEGFKNLKKSLGTVENLAPYKIKQKVIPESFYNNSDVLVAIKNLNEDLLDYDNLIGK